MENKIIHKQIVKESKIYYLCNQAVGITKGKYTKEWTKVTCQNCIKQYKGRWIRKNNGK